MTLRIFSIAVIVVLLILIGLLLFQYFFKGQTELQLAMPEVVVAAFVTLFHAIFTYWEALRVERERRWRFGTTFDSFLKETVQLLRELAPPGAQNLPAVQLWCMLVNPLPGFFGRDIQNLGTEFKQIVERIAKGLPQNVHRNQPRFLFVTWPTLWLRGFWQQLKQSGHLWEKYEQAVDSFLTALTTNQETKQPRPHIELIRYGSIPFYAILGRWRKCGEVHSKAICSFLDVGTLPVVTEQDPTGSGDTWAPWVASEEKKFVEFVESVFLRIRKQARSGQWQAFEEVSILDTPSIPLYRAFFFGYEEEVQSTEEDGHPEMTGEAGEIFNTMRDLLQKRPQGLVWGYWERTRVNEKKQR